jgi:hypothetical protein
MAYVPTELRLIVGGAMSNLSGPNIWSLDSTDALATVDTAAYISDATARGVRVGDVVLVRVWTSLTAKTSLSAISFMAVASISAAGAANLTDGTAISVTNTD